MKWITRSHDRVDHLVCPGLITRFTDNEAKFRYVPVLVLIWPRTG